MEQKLIAVRLDPEQLIKLEKIVRMTGWNQSEVIRQLIDGAQVTPPAVVSRIARKKGDALIVRPETTLEIVASLT
jgi:hypothetical protein